MIVIPSEAEESTVDVILEKILLWVPRLRSGRQPLCPPRVLEYVWLLIIALVLASCAGPPVVPEKPRPPLVKLQPSHYPDFTDAKDPASLSEAVGNTLAYLSRLPQSRMIEYGDESAPVSAIKESLAAFREFLGAGPSPALVKEYILENFDVYSSSGPDGDTAVFFTGYFSPELKARRQRDDTFRHPVYRLPGDLVTADLGLFSGKLAGEKVTGMVEDGRFVPYFTRAEIEGGGGLSGRGLETAWCDDPVEIFFLQIQGSGTLVFEDGARMNINYAGANGRPYRSIGKLLIERGKAQKEEMSLDWLRAYLKAHPEEAREIMDYNESYVFFRLEECGPFGCFGVPVTEERSIATDTRFFPPGALAFIDTEVPAFDGNGYPAGWEPYKGIVLNQDTGGAIKGTGRVDIYFGSGRLAELRAGYMKRGGRLFFLAPKREKN